jgi:hypothetical protein
MQTILINVSHDHILFILIVSDCNIIISNVVGNCGNSTEIENIREVILHITIKL